MAALLACGARVTGIPAVRAAAWLLAASTLPGTPAFAAHVTVTALADPGRDGRVALAAQVNSWGELTDDLAMRSAGDDLRLLVLAGSYATGQPVMLSLVGTCLSPAAARAAAEAALIAAGHDHLLHVTTVPAAGDGGRNGRHCSLHPGETPGTDPGGTP
jgi:hypothetical protein